MLAIPPSGQTHQMSTAEGLQTGGQQRYVVKILPKAGSHCKFTLLSGDIVTTCTPRLLNLQFPLCLQLLRLDDLVK